MRQSHAGAEKLFFDYAGDRVEVFDRLTGEARSALIFGAVMGASSFTCAEATWTKGLADWIGGQIRAFEAIGGVAHLIVPDNINQDGGDQGVPLRARGEPDLRRDGGVL
jgi:transposase